ncbi:MAG TPA: hypothetical protein VFI25_07110 [Planctomycetota bacterium]|jgi:hypothetical protein|nr:hypothetical protein [Planctomycetota bacterium]
MRARVCARLLSAFVLASLAASAAAQPNVVAGRDISMSSVGVFQNGHSGVYPNGVVAFGISTTACNPGTATIPWFAQPNPNHPFIAFLIARETAGRFTQISNRSYCKHPFSSTNTLGCTPSCSGGPSTQLVVGCSDTYGGAMNGSYSLLGPPDEIDPWTGVWSMTCSYFDYGVPPQPTCDGQASSISYGSNPTAPPRCNVNDSALTVPGSTYYAQAGWITAGELESLRGNNFVSRGFVPTFSGGAWSFGSLTTQLAGSVLQRWSGATLDSNTNGADDGRLFVAGKVTGPTNGLFHYEFAAHNRDNDRGVAAFRLPICPGARVENAGFEDIDTNAANDWSFFQTPSEISWAGATTNALRWNSIFNFWFDSDAAPVTGPSVLLDQADAGPGLATVSVTTTVPLGLYNVHLGPGCGAGSSPSLFAIGTPSNAAIPNASFALRTTGNAANAPVGLILAYAPGTFDLGAGCTLYAASVAGAAALVGAVCDGSGAATFAAPVPSDPALEGLTADVQAFSVQAGGPFLGSFAFSNGLQVRLGNSIPTCP